ncbi:hypothetical protein [Agromyces bauzanensis]|uniref:EcsC family protein n=1 Tax=Agromyces bauzanensis TaxID=1308924 RepID=A0A917UM97_9MICO|nr:hypothetical protein [Agromyces bauzanensis]GGJ67736.1 hypothetical protein GCM10011372_01910 [Agromyces bauzanensis]
MTERVHKITSMGPSAPRESEPENTPGGPDGAQADLGRAHGVERGIDAVLSIQRPVVVAHLRGIRRRFPNATPDQIVRILERRYLAAVTTGGVTVGATAVIPGIGTGVTLALSSVETAGFLEATALFAQSVAEVHGIAVENPERARALVMTLMLGREGIDLVRQLAAQATGQGVARSAYWGELVTNSMPKAVMGTVVDRLRTVFIRQFAVRGGVGVIGKAIPFGIGAAIGGAGNHLLGRKVLQQSRLAFGAPPALLRPDLEPRGDDSMVKTAALRMSRAGLALGGFAVSSSRGLRAAAARAVRGRGRSEPQAAIDAADRTEVAEDARDPKDPEATRG